MYNVLYETLSKICAMEFLFWEKADHPFRSMECHTRHKGDEKTRGFSQ
jgi:hypothetical protein